MERVEELIREYGGLLVRTKRHFVYRFPDGRIFILSSTPSDSHTERNSLADLRKFLGIKRESNKNPDRKRKTGVARFNPTVVSHVNTLDWKEKLYRAFMNMEG